jgi:hypothetical protein
VLRSKFKLLIVIAVLGVASSVSAGYFDGSRPTSQGFHAFGNR